MKKKKSIPVKVYTRKELRMLYNVPQETFNKWLEQHEAELQIKRKKILTIKQVELIFEKFGIPGEIEID